MRAFTQIAALIAATAARPSVAKTHAQCNYALEIVLIQDGTTSFDGIVDNFAHSFSQFASMVQEDFEDVKFGVSSFADKPIPFRGFGHWGGWSFRGVADDYCYKLHRPLEAGFDSNQSQKYFRDLRDAMGSGGDLPETPFEGLLHAALDEKVGWTPPETTHTPAGLPIARIALVVTDNLAHTNKWMSAKNAIDAWNYPRTTSWPNKGGFGSLAPVFNEYIPGDDLPMYRRAAELFHKIDLNQALTKAEEQELERALARLGPYPFEAVLPHPGDASMPCEKVEYPDVDAVGKQLEERGIMPIFLLKGDQSMDRKLCGSYGTQPGIDCLLRFYEDQVKNYGVPAHVSEFTPETIYKSMLTAISDLVEKKCLYTTAAPAPIVTTPAPATKPVATKPVVPKPIPATKPEDDDKPLPATIPEDDTTTTAEGDTTTTAEGDTTTTPEGEIITTTPEGETTTVAGSGKPTPPAGKPTPPAAGTTTPSEDATTTTSETTTDPDVVPVVVPVDGASASASSGPKKSVIVGAAAGGAGAILAAAAAVYGKVAFFGAQNAPTVDGAQQVEMPENTVERETMEEVTMDMFQ